MKTVLFFLWASSDRQSMIIKEVRESRPEVGQSSIMTCGSLISQKAMEVLFFSPPEIPFKRWPPTNTSIHFSSFILAAIDQILQSFFYLDRSNLRLATNQRVSLTVSVCINTSFCITQFAKLPNDEQSQGFLLAQRLPYVGFILQASKLSSVVFPAPDVPIKAVTSPALQIPLILLRIVLVIFFFDPSCLFQTQTEQVILRKVISMPLFGLDQLIQSTFPTLSVKGCDLFIILLEFILLLSIFMFENLLCIF